MHHLGHFTHRPPDRERRDRIRRPLRSSREHGRRLAGDRSFDRPAPARGARQLAQLHTGDPNGDDGLVEVPVTSPFRQVAQRGDGSVATQVVQPDVPAGSETMSERVADGAGSALDARGPPEARGGGPEDFHPRVQTDAEQCALPFRRSVCQPRPANSRTSENTGRRARGRNGEIVEFAPKNWRRRPDLNRGWRFCRFRRVPFLDGWSCFLVRGTRRFYVVFGRFCSRIVLESRPEPDFARSPAALATWQSLSVARSASGRSHGAPPPSHPYNRVTLVTESGHPSRRLRNHRPAR